jgi:hypothetical protein
MSLLGLMGNGREPHVIAISHPNFMASLIRISICSMVHRIVHHRHGSVVGLGSGDSKHRLIDVLNRRFPPEHDDSRYSHVEMELFEGIL